MIQSLTIDLTLPPEKRWRLNEAQGEQARELLEIYNLDFGPDSHARAAIAAAAQSEIPYDYWLEMESLAELLSLPVSDVVFGTVYYDSVKVMLNKAFGCTAFGVQNGLEILHARNLDWWSTNEALNRSTVLIRFVGGAQGEFTVVGWPGFADAFSGVAPGRFDVTLNAVLSEDPPQLAMPVEFLLRQVLEQEPDFESTVARLNETPIPRDCPLLVTGAKAGELAAIERTPTPAAVRWASDGFICATNDYRRLDTRLNAAPSPLSATCCGRYQKTLDLAAAHRPQTPEEFFQYLSNDEVRMGITVQQMVFSAAAGQHWVRLPT